MNADDLLADMLAEHDKIVAGANRQLNQMVDQYRHDLGVMVAEHNKYLKNLASSMAPKVRKPKVRK